MIIPLINIPFSSINLYQKPSNMRSGERNLHLERVLGDRPGDAVPPPS